MRPDGSSTTGLRSSTLALLLLVLGVALALRFGAIARLLPVEPEPDASSAWVYRELAGEEIGAEMHRLHYVVYPILAPRVMSWVMSKRSLRPAPDEATLEEHLHAASAAYLHLRCLVALVSAFIVPVLFFVARRWLADAWALLASALVAIGLLHIAHSSVAKAHAADVTLLWLAILMALRQFEKPSLPRICASIVATALAIGMMGTGYFALPPLCAAALLAHYPPRSLVLRSAAWLAPIPAVLGGLLFVPVGLSIGEKGVTTGGHTILFDKLDGRGIVAWAQMFWEHDPVLCVFAALGLALVIVQRVHGWRATSLRAPWLFIAAFALPYTAVISLDENVADRYLLPLYPLFALLAAIALERLLIRLRSPAWRAAVLALILALPAWTAFRFTWLGTRPTTPQQLARWIESQPDPTSKRTLLSPFLAPTLFPTQLSLARQLQTSTGRSQPWFYYLSKLDHVPESAPHYDLEPMTPVMFAAWPAPSGAEVASYFDEQKPDWIVLEVSARIWSFPSTAVIYQVLCERGEKLITISGEGGRYPGDKPIDYQSARHLAARVLKADAFGPQLEIFRWRAH